MSQQALIHGDVSFRAGDGMMLPIPDGPVEIELTDDSATLGWHDAGEPNSAAITRDEFERLVHEGKIKLRD